MATLDLVNNSVSPGTNPRTLNGQSPLATAYDTGNQRLYVGAYDSKTVLVVDPITRTVLDAIPVPAGPVSMVYDPAGGEIFVAMGGLDSLTVINDSLNAIVASVPIPSGIANVSSSPSDLVYVALNQTVLVAQSGNLVCCTFQISVVDAVTNQVINHLPGGPNLIALAYNDRNGLLYGLSGRNSSIIVDDVATGAQLATWPVPFVGNQTGITVDPNDGLVYVGTTSWSDWANVTEISAAFGTVVHQITVHQAGAFFGPASPVYSSATGKVFLSARSVELFPITANTGLLGPGSAIGSCVGPVTLTASGAPMMAVDVCADNLLWLDTITGALSHTTSVGADPVSVTQVSGSNAIAVAEYYTQRIDLLDGSTLSTYQSISLPFGEFSTALTADPITGWVYGIDGGYGTTSVSAYDPISGATMWSSPCASCWLEAIGDDNGTIYATSADVAHLAEVLYRFNATTGAASPSTLVSGLPVLPIYNLTLGGLVALPNSSTVVVSVPIASVVIALNASSGQVLWSRPTGNGTGPVALVPGTDLVALGSGNLSGGIEFVNASSGAWSSDVVLPSLARSITSGGAVPEVYALAGGVVYRVSAGASGGAVAITAPTAAGLNGVFYLAGSGGVAVPSRTYGAVFWIGATLNISAFGASGPTVQGESLSLVANVSGGYGAETFAYAGLPPGCSASSTPNLNCLPLSAGGFSVQVTANDSTGLPGATASASLALSPYPLVVNITTISGSTITGGSVVLAAALEPAESGIAPYLNFTWVLTPASAGTLNNSTSSSVNVSFTAAGAVSLSLTTDFRGTTIVTYANFTVGTLGSSAPLFGLSGTMWELLLGGIVVGVVAVVAIALVLRSRRNRTPTGPGETPVDSPPTESIPESPEATDPSAQEPGEPD